MYRPRTYEQITALVTVGVPSLRWRVLPVVKPALGNTTVISPSGLNIVP